MQRQTTTLSLWQQSKDHGQTMRLALLGLQRSRLNKWKSAQKTTQNETLLRNTVYSKHVCV